MRCSNASRSAIRVRISALASAIAFTAPGLPSYVPVNANGLSAALTSRAKTRSTVLQVDPSRGPGACVLCARPLLTFGTMATSAAYGLLMPCSAQKAAWGTLMLAQLTFGTM